MKAPNGMFSEAPGGPPIPLKLDRLAVGVRTPYAAHPAHARYAPAPA
jgi:hypothetical protein